MKKRRWRRVVVTVLLVVAPAVALAFAGPGLVEAAGPQADGDTHIITASAGEGGSIDPVGAVEVTEPNDQSFTITPATGYHVDDVLVDGDSVGATTYYDFVDVAQDHTIYATFVPGAQTRASLSAGKTVIDYGASTVLSGTLFDVSDPGAALGLGDQPVTVQSAPSAGGPWTDVPEVPTLTTSVEPGSVGAFSATVTPPNTIFYRVRFIAEANSEYGDCVSYVVRVSVRPLLGRPQVRTSVRSGRSFTVYGSLRPLFPAGQKTVKVKIYRYKNRRWVYVRQVSATNVDNLPNTRYTVKLKLTAKGRYRFRAYTVATTSWAADSTRLSTVLRVR